MPRPASPTRYRLAFVVVLALALGAGCVSTEKRYGRALDLEAEHRYEEAADYYIQVVDREPDWKDAPARLQEAGRLAISGLLVRAESYRQQGRYEDALAALDRLDALRLRAADVGVPLPVRDDYDAYRADLVERAVEQIVEWGDVAARAGRWQRALGFYERAQRAFVLTPAHRAELDRARAEVFVGWAAQELARERYRSAFAKAETALGILAAESPTETAEHAFAIQDDALVRGTHIVAFTPLRRATDGGDARGEQPDGGRPDGGRGGVLPRDFASELDDLLFDAYWSAPPLFVAPADPVRVRREVRRIGSRRGRLDPRDAAEIGRVVGADFVTTAEIVRYAVSADTLGSRTRRARTRGRAPTDTSYQELDLRLRHEATVRFALVDPYSRRVVHEEEVTSSVDERVRRGQYAGDVRTLQLTGPAAALFDPDEEARTEGAMLARLRDRLAADVADRLYTRVLDRIE